MLGRRLFTAGLSRLIIESFRYCQQNKELKVHAYVIMSNHVHGIISSAKQGLSYTVRDFKKHTAQQIFESMDHGGFESRSEWLNMIFKYHARYNKRNAKRQFWTH